MSVSENRLSIIIHVASLLCNHVTLALIGQTRPLTGRFISHSDQFLMNKKNDYSDWHQLLAFGWCGCGEDDWLKFKASIRMGEKMGPQTWHAF